MITKLTIENFQSHKRTEIEFSPGVTVLVGESDVGKSAVVRVLRWLFLNEPRGAGFMRQGAAHCKASLLYGNGTVVERFRNRERNLYAVTSPDGTREIFEGFGTDVPEEVLSVTGVRKLSVGDVSFAPNIAGQLEAPFLLSEPGSTAALLLGTLSKADVFDAALKDALADSARLRREARSLEADVAMLEQELEDYADLPRWEEAVRESSRLLEETRAAHEKKASLERLFSERAEVKAALEKCARLVEAGEHLESAEIFVAEASRRFSNKTVLREFSLQIEAARGELARAAETISATENVSGAGALLETAGICRERLSRLADLKRQLAEASGEAVKASSILEATSGVTEASSFVLEAGAANEKLKQLREACGALAAARGELTKSFVIVEVGRTVQEAGELVEAAVSLSGTLGTLKRLSFERRGADAVFRESGESVDKAARQLESSAQSLGELLERLGKCPVCFSEIENERVHDIVRSIIE